MSLAKLLTASLLGAVSLTSGVVATRDILDVSRFQSLIDSHRDTNAPKPDDSSKPPTGAVSGGSSSGSKKVNVSSASCTAFANGFSELNNDNAIASATADAKAFICGSGEKTSHDIAEATASAFAIAVAFAAVNCESKGETKVHASASARAEASATVWLEAYAEAFAKAGDCDECYAFAESWGRIRKEVFLSAVAEADATISGATNGGSLALKATVFQQTVAEAVATAFAEALAATKTSYYNNECVAWVVAGGCVDGSCFECEAAAVSLSEIYEIDAIAIATANASAFACGDDTIQFADVETTARAVAEATAIAVSFVFASCTSDEEGFACADAGTHISDSAFAVAGAFAEAFAEALDCGETCTVNVNSTAEAIGDILVTAATSAYGSVCVEDAEAWTVTELQQQIETGYLEAIAEAIAFAVVSNEPELCAASVSVNTYVQPVH